MNEITYVGEHLWVGYIGHFSIILAFVAALLSGVAYFFGTQNRNTPGLASSWNKIGRYSFYVHGLAIFTLIASIFYAMYHNYIEYSYVFDHVSEDLPLKFILAAFWEGQEGSFMLWMFWHVILGVLLIKTSGKFEAPVMATVAIVEVILVSMILGIYIPWGDEALKIGSNPTTLLRQINDAPVFANANYLELIKGRGLNPLLQNYWMTIHPPTLFLGFASTVVPFAYAIAGLWLNDHKEWMENSLHWSMFSAGILGTGILMGSLWAYVALSFGGYWAWDPVENASLVPWITLVAGLHVHLVSKHTEYSRRSVYFFYIISFILVLYSTFLTRSGILGDSSAHAFTEMGLENQLLIFILVFAIIGFGLFFYRYKEIKNPEKEEELGSREFWMFIGSLVLLFSAILITLSTSLPVYNKIMAYFNPAHEGRVINDPIAHHNKYQMWIAIFVAILSSFSLFMRFKALLWERNKGKFYKRMLIALGISAVLTYISSFFFQYYSWQYWLMCLAAMFSIVINLEYMVDKAKRKSKLAWSATSHFGFGLMMLGLLTSGLNSKHISSNEFVFRNMFEGDGAKKYVQLIKGKPLYSQGYFITYMSDTLVERERTYAIKFEKLNDSLEIIDTFVLHPNAVYDNDFSKIATFNPDTKHLIHKDIFTAVVGLPQALTSAEMAKEIEESLEFKTYSLAINDTIQVENLIIEPTGVTFTPDLKNSEDHDFDAALGVKLKITDTKTDSVFMMESAFGLQNSLIYNFPAEIADAGVRIKLSEEIIEKYFIPDDSLNYTEFVIKPGESMPFQGYDIRLMGFNRTPDNTIYIPEEDDVALGAMLNITGHGINDNVEPIFILRDKQSVRIKGQSVISGLHIIFDSIDPQNEEFHFRVAKNNLYDKNVDLSIAKDVPRNDYLILQAILFPWINFFWFGCIFMMAGLLLAAFDRYKKSRAQK